jgi:hypothetical protein
MEAPLCPGCGHPLEVEDPDDLNQEFWWCDNCNSLFAKEEIDVSGG